ncbi:two-component sensor histidine kinase [Micromonospora sp. WMMA2032]|uniref:sensor histidine kinase n=1 Tax=unclassified Micromonospora TaxID=2617518 RepID=UPI000C0591DA|nr:histidine kinase [Micromonospora sp. WMMA2032]ATO16708.1 two-component sensor histidine kinase [Micromonospora sp. WMMA2032]
MRGGRWTGWPELLLGLGTAALGLISTRIVIPGIPREAWAGVFAVLAGLLLIGVRRWPWPVLLATSALLVVADTVTVTGADTAQFAASVALGYVAYRSGWPGTAVAYGLFLAVTLVNVIDPGNAELLRGGVGVLRVLMLAGFAAAPVTFGRYLRGVRQAAAAAEERAREAEERRTTEARMVRLTERTAIARDLHDIVAHHVAAIALRAGSARYAVQHTGRPEEAVTALGELRDTAGQVLDELRELLEVLRDPDAVEPAESQVEPVQVIRDAARRVREAGLAVQVRMPEMLHRVPLVVGTTAARVVQEALTNSLKHAGPGAVVSVDVRVTDGALLLEVLDSGPARPRTRLPVSGHGLRGMRERVGLLGGTLVAGGTDGGGWRLRVRLPIRENE